MLCLLACDFCETPNYGNLGGVFDPFVCSWDPFPLTGLPHPDLIGGFGSSFPVTCYTVFGGYQIIQRLLS